MPDFYVRSTDGDNADSGATWALAKATVVGASAVAAAGDNVYVSQDHSEVTAAGVTLAFAGTTDNVSRLVCGNDASQPPFALSTLASVATSGASSIALNGSLYCYGVRFSAGTASSSASLLIATPTTPTVVQLYEATEFVLNHSNSAGAITLGAAGSSNSATSSIVWKNVGVRFGSNGQRIQTYVGFKWLGGYVLPGSVGLSHLLRCGSNGRGSPVLIEGVNFENLGMGTHLVNGPSCTGLVTIRECRLPSGWTGSLVTGACPVGLRVEMFNCDNASTNYRLWIEDYAGSIKSETGVVCTGGASDGATALSWRMDSSAGAKYPATPLKTGEIARWNDLAGSPVTVSVEVITDGVTLTDEDCWLEIQYLGASGAPLTSYVSDEKANILAAPANQESSSADWSSPGVTTPVKQKLSVTFTPQMPGFLYAVVNLARPSTTVFVDPKLRVA